MRPRVSEIDWPMYEICRRCVHEDAPGYPCNEATLTGVGGTLTWCDRLRAKGDENRNDSHTTGTEVDE